MDSFLRLIQDAWTSHASIAWGVAAGLAGLLLLVVLRRLLRRRRAAAAPAVPQLTVDVSSLGDAGPRAGPPAVELFHIPVRLAAVVLAPPGRLGEIPPPAALGGWFDALVPGLDRVVALDEPLVRRWPPQLSVRGFARVFFANVRLPGDGGKGTPWSAAAGAVKFRGKTLMIGLVFRAAAPNSLGQLILDSEEKWLGCLQVRLE
jgi:hypothetical protein